MLSFDHALCAQVVVKAVKARLLAQVKAITEGKEFDPSTQEVYDEASQKNVKVQDVVGSASQPGTRTERIMVDYQPVDMTVMREEHEYVHVRTNAAGMNKVAGSDALVYAAEHGYSQSDLHGDRNANLPSVIQQ